MLPATRRTQSLVSVVTALLVAALLAGVMIAPRASSSSPARTSTAWCASFDVLGCHVVIKPKR